jgi:hypothetical protein
MKKTSLSVKKERLTAQQERLKKQRQLLQVQERKQRAKRLIDLGALIDKAGLGHLSPEELLGALISLKPLAEDEKQKAAWATQVHESLKGEPISPTTPLVITCAKPPSHEIKAQLKTLGFHWNRFRNEWQGYGDVEAIKKHIKSDGLRIDTLKA